MERDFDVSFKGVDGVIRVQAADYSRAVAAAARQAGLTSQYPMSFLRMVASVRRCGRGTMGRPRKALPFDFGK